MSDATTMFTLTYRENMTKSEWMVSADAKSPCNNNNNNARLWALYVGAYLEQAEVARTGDSADKEWFNVRLVSYARAMGLLTWEPLRERLLHFLHTDVLQPHGSIWFPRIMDANL